MIPHSTFFDSILCPDFLKPEFEKEDWYMVIKNFIKILEENLTEETHEFPNVKISGKVHIGKGTVVGDYTVIEGPAYIGDNVEIGPGSFIRAGSIIGNGCVVGHAAEVKNALMMDEAKISNHAFLGDGILGAKTRMGGHSEMMNRRFDQKEIPFLYNDEQVATGLDKLGAVIGEGARLGGAVLTVPGAMIGKKTFVASGVVVNGFIPAEKFVKSENKYTILDNKFDGELNNQSKLYNG